MDTDTTLFARMNAADAAFRADDMNLDLLHVLEAAEKAYFAELAIWRARWTEIPTSDAKYSAETNAEDSEGTAEDELRYLQIAVRTYEMNIDAGYYNPDGSEKN